VEVVWKGSPDGEATLWELESEMLKSNPQLFSGNF